MKKFLFLTCLTPDAFLTDLRKDLHKCYIKALLEQESNDWTAFLLGEKEGLDGNIRYIQCKGKTKEDKLMEALEYLNALPEKPEFIVRLDDDDLISKHALQTVERMKNAYEVFTDHYQYMFDSYSGKVLSKVYPWWPSTIIMRYRDAVTPNTEFGNKPLFACPHDLAFHHFFKNHTVFYFQKDDPAYVRIFSPTSTSFRLYEGKLDEEKYKRYITNYGFWRYETDERSRSLRKTYAPLAQKHYQKTYSDLSSLWNGPMYMRYQLAAVLRKMVHKIRSSNT